MFYSILTAPSAIYCCSTLTLGQKRLLNALNVKYVCVCVCVALFPSHLMPSSSARLGSWPWALWDSTLHRALRSSRQRDISLSSRLTSCMGTGAPRGGARDPSSGCLCFWLYKRERERFLDSFHVIDEQVIRQTWGLIVPDDPIDLS